MYTFTTKNPPLLAKEKNILDVPPQSLTQSTGAPARWIKNYEDRNNPFFRRYYENTFTADRFLTWKRIKYMEHLAADTEITLTNTQGYSKTTKEATSQFIEVDVHADISDMFTADVKASLRIDHSIDQTWTVTDGESRKETWLAGETYVAWALTDTIRIQKTLVTWLYGDDGNKQTSFSSINFDCILFVYEDTTAPLPKHLPRGQHGHSAEISIDPGRSFLGRRIFANMPCSKCSCGNFADVNFDGYCDNHGCGHDFDDHHY